jgi:hypothetical protein
VYVKPKGKQLELYFLTYVDIFLVDVDEVFFIDRLQDKVLASGEQSVVFELTAMLPS